MAGRPFRPVPVMEKPTLQSKIKQGMNFEWEYI